MSEKPSVEALTSAASRSYGRIISKFKSIKNMGIKTYETLYESYVLSILNYAARVWGYNEQPAPQTLQNRVQRFFLGVHTFPPVCATKLEFDWPEVKSLRWTEMIRYLNRLKKMPNKRWPKQVFMWDLSLKLKGG